MFTSWSSRRAGAALMAVALVAAVGGGSGVLTAPAAAMSGQAPVDFDDYDPALVTKLMGEGYSEGEALFIALTKVDAKEVGDDRVRLTDSFPTGNQAVIDIRIAATDDANPEALKIKSRSAGGDFKFSLKYTVSLDAIPVDVQPELALGSRASGSTVSLASFGLPNQGGDDPHGVQVIVKGLVEQFSGDKTDNFLKEMDKKLKAPKLDALNNKLKAAKVAGDLMAMGIELQELLNELDALEECAKKPTNPLTKKTYKESPGDRDRLLKEIASTRAELQGNTAAGVIGTINSTASGLIPGAPAWLGYVIGPGTSWAVETLKQVSQERMNEIRKGVVPCEYDLKIDGTAGTPPAHLTALKCGGPVGTWDVAYDQPAANSSGSITVTIGKGGAGTWQAAGTAGGQESGNAGTVQLTMAPHGKSGTLTFSLLGSVAVTGGDFCAKGK